MFWHKSPGQYTARSIKPDGSYGSRIWKSGFVPRTRMQKAYTVGSIAAAGAASTLKYLLGKGAKQAVSSAAKNVTMKAINKLSRNATAYSGSYGSSSYVSRNRQAYQVGSSRFGGRRQSFRNRMPRRRFPLRRKFKRRMNKSRRYRSRRSSMTPALAKFKALPTELVYKTRGTAEAVAAVNKSAWTQSVLNDLTTLQAGMANGRFFNPSVPGTLITADLSTGTYGRNIYWCAAMRAEYTNNNHVPIRVKLYGMKTLGNHSVNFVNTYVALLSDQTNQTLETAKLIEPEEIRNMGKFVKILKKSSRVLQPGQSMSMVVASKARRFDPSYADTTAFDYQQCLDTKWICARVDGLLGHESGAPNIRGDMTVTLDYKVDLEYRYKYDGGFSSKYIHTVDSSGAITSAAVRSVPASGNYAFTYGAVSA